MSKIADQNPEIKQAIEALKKYMGNDEMLQANYYATLLACGKGLGEFILENHQLKDIPREIQYFLAMIWNSYALVYQPDRVIGGYDENFQNYFESGSLDDRFAYVVKQLYQICKEDNLLS